MTTRTKQFNSWFSTFAAIVLSVSIGTAQPNVTVINPNGGEVYETGDVSVVTWLCTNQSIVAVAVIEYSIDDGDHWTLIDYNIPSGSLYSAYPWTIPYHYSLHCMVKVTVFDPAPHSPDLDLLPDPGDNNIIPGMMDWDESDDVFTIHTLESTHTFYQGWSLMSLPLSPDDNDKEEVIGDDIDRQWQLIGFEPDQGYYYPEEMELGEAYWLAVVFDDSVNVDVQGESSIVPYTFDLDLAWNFIGYPFPNSFAIENVIFTRDNVEYTLDEAIDNEWVLPIFYTAAPELGNWGYWYHFGPVTTYLAHWRGYLFLTMVDSLQMTLDPWFVNPGPPPGYGSGPCPLSNGEASPDEWALTLLVGTEESICSALRLGANADATDEFDLRFDFPPSRAFFESRPLDAYFIYEDWQDYFDSDRYICDIRNTLNDEVAEYTFIVDGQEEVILRWPGIFEETPEGYQFTLEDPVTHQSVDMRADEEYIFESRNDTRELIIHVYSTPYDVSDEISASQPAEFSILTTYPNPFNLTLNIAYRLANNSDVVVSVHDLTGRAIAVLTNNYQPAGIYTSIWNADKMATGVYLVRVATSDFSEVRKVMLVK